MIRIQSVMLTIDGCHCQYVDPVLKHRVAWDQEFRGMILYQSEGTIDSQHEPITGLFK